LHRDFGLFGFCGIGIINAINNWICNASEGDDMNLVQNGEGKARRDQGMTLLETMISVLILAIFMLGVAALITQSGKLGDMSRDHYIAVNLCRNRLENANVFTYNTGFESLTTLRETNFVCSDTGAADPDGRFMRSTAVIENYLSASNLTEMVVTVAIRDRISLSFSNQSETVQTIFTRY
jgi:prepilin-type N-terminal cleavage/methylation domain-containing protein